MWFNCFQSVYPQIFSSQQFIANLPSSLCERDYFSLSQRESNEFLLTLTEIILSRNYFQYAGSYYLRRRGVSMGSSSAPLLACSVMGFRKEKFIHNSANNPFLSKISLWKKAHSIFPDRHQQILWITASLPHNTSISQRSSPNSKPFLKIWTFTKTK